MTVGVENYGLRCSVPAHKIAFFYVLSAHYIALLRYSGIEFFSRNKALPLKKWLGHILVEGRTKLPTFQFKILSKG
jgi:hypothetical protein